MGNIPVAWWLSPAWELTLNIGVISAPYSSWACLLLCAMMKFFWLTFKLLQQSHPETLPPSVCLQTVAHSHLLHQGQRKTGSGERQVSACSSVAKPAPRHRQRRSLLQFWTEAADRYQRGKESLMDLVYLGMQGFSKFWEQRVVKNRNRIKKKCTHFPSSLFCLQYHLVGVDVVRYGLNRQGDCNPKSSYGTQKDRKFWKNT